MFLCKAMHRQRFVVALGALERNLQFSLYLSANQRFISGSSQFEEQGEVSNASSYAAGNGDLEGKNTKPYDVLFREAVGLSERSGDFWDGDEVGDVRNVELSRRFREVELDLKELREKCGGFEPKLKGNSGRRIRRKAVGEVKEDDSANPNSKPASSLSSMFNKNVKKEQEKRESSVGDKQSTGERSKSSKKVSSFELFGKELNEPEDLIVKELSPEMEVFARYLYEEGYFEEANFLPGNKFNAKSFENAYAQDFLKFAAEKFGRDKQEIAKWLSGSDLKTIAIFGCPSNDKRIAFAAKSLRRFFQIPENTVCSKCIIKESCKFVNQSIWKSGSKHLNLPSLMRLLTVYALEAIPPQQRLPNDIKACVSRLIKDVINLSRTVGSDKLLMS